MAFRVGETVRSLHNLEVSDVNTGTSVSIPVGTAVVVGVYLPNTAQDAQNGQILDCFQATHEGFRLILMADDFSSVRS